MEGSKPEPLQEQADESVPIEDHEQDQWTASWATLLKELESTHSQGSIDRAEKETRDVASASTDTEGESGLARPRGKAIFIVRNTVLTLNHAGRIWQNGILYKLSHQDGQRFKSLYSIADLHLDVGPHNTYFCRWHGKGCGS